MHTYYLGDEEIRGYIRDFLGRLSRLDPFPEVWCPITRSGGEILKAISRVAKDSDRKISAVKILPVSVAREGDITRVSFLGTDAPETLIPGKSVLLLDGAVHSGKTMRECADEVLKHAPVDLASYSLVVKSASAFVPTMWGLTVGETDRAFFLLPEIPNHRLDIGGGSSRKSPPVRMERLEECHLAGTPVACGVDSMDRMHWSDRHYQMMANENPPCTYLLRRGASTVGYLTVHFSASGQMTIDEIAVDKAHHGQGYGGILMRFADTLARHANCRTIRLNGIGDKVPFYEGLGYKKTDRPSPLRLDSEEYWPMERPVMYHQTLLELGSLLGSSTPQTR